MFHRSVSEILRGGRNPPPSGCEMGQNNPALLGLSEQSVFCKTDRVCQVWCNFKPCCWCRTTVIFGTLKNGSLQINCLVFNIIIVCFNYKTASKMASTPCLNIFLSKKLKILFSLDLRFLFKIYLCM